MRRLNANTESVPLMSELRVDYKDINGSNLTLLVCQRTNKIYYSKSGISKLRDMYSEFKYLCNDMLKVNMYIPMSLCDSVSMVKGVDYYF